MARKFKYTPPSAFTTGVNRGYVPLYVDMLTSAAYIALPAPAKEVYTILRMQYKGNYTGNSVKCPYKTFRSMGMRNSTISRALKTLELFGFITYEKGGLAHQPNIYHFSEQWKTIKIEDISKLKNELKES